jgi:hypothetical protein
MKKEHRDFLKYKDDCIDLSNFFEGERKIKEKGERYTPRLEGHIDKDGLYTQYVNFGILYNALSRTRQGLKGAIFRKPINIQFPESKKEVLDFIMPDGSSFEDLVRLITDDVLGYGRCGVLVDLTPSEEPYAAFYNSLSILNWPSSFNFSLSFGKEINQEIELQEFIEIPDPENTDETKTIEQRRILAIDGAGYYVVNVYRKIDKNKEDWILYEGPIYPDYKGKKLDFIPFVFFGSSSNVPSPSRPPLLDLLNLLKGHWRLTVAYQYGLHFAGLPTPCFAGFDIEDGVKMALGPGAAYHTSEPQAKSWFLQTGGQGLIDMERGLDRLEKQMAVIGARLLEEQRPGVEAAETVRLRSSGDSATLADIAGNIGEGATQVLKYIGFWLGIPEKECNVGINKDFVNMSIGPQEITAYLQAVQAGQMSSETFIWNLMQGEALSPGRTIEDEREAIAEDKLVAQRNNKNLAGIAGEFLT